MAEYNVTANGTRDFQLRTGDQVLGTLHYTQWYSFKAELALADGSLYQIEPKGFWGTTIEVKDQEKVLLNFKMNWAGNILIKSKFNSKAFVFKHKSVLKGTYVLQDKNEQEVLVVQPSLTWKTLSYDYTLFTTPELEAVDAKALLLLTTIHCANYYMTMMSSSAATIIATT